MQYLSSRRMLGLVLAIVLIGCSQPTPETNSDTNRLPPLVQTTSIKTLKNTSLQNKTVYLKGRVGNLVPVLDGTVYELQDPTGTVWILTKGQPPGAGQEAIVKGVVRYKSIQLDGKEQGSLYVEQIS